MINRISYLSLISSGNKRVNRLATGGYKNVASVPALFQAVGNIFKCQNPHRYWVCGGVLPMLPLLPLKTGLPRKVFEGRAA